MSRQLEYFDDFLNNPASLTNRQFNEKLSDWIDFVKANPGKYELLGKGWTKARARIETDLRRRDLIRDEFEEIDAVLEEAANLDDTNLLKIQQRFLTFMKTYQLEYEYSDETIANAEAVLNKFAKSVEAARIADINLQIANAEAEISANELADTMFELSDQLGKPIIIPAYKTPKRGRDN